MKGIYRDVIKMMEPNRGCINNPAEEILVVLIADGLKKIKDTFLN